MAEVTPEKTQKSLVSIAKEQQQSREYEELVPYENALLAGGALTVVSLLTTSGYFVGRQIVKTYAHNMDNPETANTNQNTSLLSQMSKTMSGSNAKTASVTSHIPTTVVAAPVASSSAPNPLAGIEIPPPSAAVKSSYGNFTRKVDAATHQPTVSPPVSPRFSRIGTTGGAADKNITPQVVKTSLWYARRAFLWGTVWGVAGVGSLALGVCYALDTWTVRDFTTTMQSFTRRWLGTSSAPGVAQALNDTMVNFFKGTFFHRHLSTENVPQASPEQAKIEECLGESIELVLNYEVDVVSYVLGKPSRAGDQVPLEDLLAELWSKETGEVINRDDILGHTVDDKKRIDDDKPINDTLNDTVNAEKAIEGMILSSSDHIVTLNDSSSQRQHQV